MEMDSESDKEEDWVDALGLSMTLEAFCGIKS